MKNINDYIKYLSPELQKKAQDCKNIDELLKLADENDIEIPKDVLEKVSGGSIFCDHNCATDGHDYFGSTEEIIVKDPNRTFHLLGAKLCHTCQYCGHKKYSWSPVTSTDEIPITEADYNNPNYLGPGK